MNAKQVIQYLIGDVWESQKAFEEIKDELTEAQTGAFWAMRQVLIKGRSK